MIRITAPSRLHFGLLSLPPAWPNAPAWENALGEAAVAARCFGGVGLMVEQPGLVLTARPARHWHASGPLAARALDFARRFVQAAPGVPPLHLHIERTAPQHAGLGTGTQLALAVARAIALASGLTNLDSPELAYRVGRGRRSALGVRGFAQGGFLVDGGQGPSGAIAPLVARADFPEDWRVVLMTPAIRQGLHGCGETQAFELLRERGFALAQTEALCRLVLLGMLPALQERDGDAFGEALYDFNRRAGECFAPVQGGPYAGPATAELIALVRRLGARGAGQSSWGPTVFAVFADPGKAEDFVRRAGDQGLMPGVEVSISGAANQGASSEILPENDSEPAETEM
jgi:beta-RFAP synthase